MAEIMKTPGELRLTHHQGQVLLMACSGNIRTPEKLDDDLKFDVAEQAFMDHQIDGARSALYRHSRTNRDPRGTCFGDPSNWTIVSDPPRWEMVDRDDVLTVKVTEDNEDGLYTILLLLAHPRSQFASGASVMNEVVWPVAEQLCLKNQLMKDIKADQGKRRKIARDGGPSLKKVK